MTWNPFVAGVDASPESAGAAAFASRMAGTARTTCHLVHAVRDVWAAVPQEEGVEELRSALSEDARADVTAALKGAVPRELLDKLTVRIGRAPSVLKQTVTDLGAELVVLGGKHHSVLGRWLGGSTSLNVARTTEVPVLVTAGSPTAIRRVLVAVDLSRAAPPTLGAAERYAAMLGAQLRALSVFEPLPVVPDAPPVYDMAEYYAMSAELLNRDIWPLIETLGVEQVVRYGMAVETILREAVDWQADLLVVGSHGRGWAERVLVGSVTERLLNHLPTSLLVVPVAAAAVVAPAEEKHAAAVA